MGDVVVRHAEAELEPWLHGLTPALWHSCVGRLWLRPWQTALYDSVINLQDPY